MANLIYVFLAIGTLAFWLLICAVPSKPEILLPGAAFWIGVFGLGSFFISRMLR